MLWCGLGYIQYDDTPVRDHRVLGHRRAAMKRVLGISLLTAAIAAIPGYSGQGKPHSVGTRNGKPIYLQETMVIVVSSFEDLYRSADDIVQIHVNRSEVKGVGNAPHVRTFYTATVARTLKGNARKGSEITFSQFTGELELTDKIIRAAGQPPLETAERYIVFLKHSGPEWGGHILVGDVQGAYGIRHGRVEPQGTDSVSLEQRNVTENNFIDEIDRVARRVKPNE
jgi:hypothetical protein